MAWGKVTLQAHHCALALARIGSVPGLPGFGSWVGSCGLCRGSAAVGRFSPGGRVMIKDHEGLS